MRAVCGTSLLWHACLGRICLGPPPTPTLIGDTKLLPEFRPHASSLPYWHRCDAMGYDCAGFQVDLISGTCDLIPRGYGLTSAGNVDFYRKKSDPGTKK